MASFADTASSEMMIVSVNGEARRVPAGATLEALLRQADIDPDRSGIAVAVGDEVVRRQAWNDTPLSEGDRVEIITAQQGG